VMLDADNDKLVVRRRIPATREEVFDAWTSPEGMREWMCPGNTVSADVRIDLRVGGSLLIVMRDPDNVYEHRGEFMIIERPGKLAFTWIAQGTDFQPTLVTVEFFAASEAECDLVLTHEKFPGKEVRDRYSRGWGQITERLQQYLQTKR
jgi:uncharacterized protein YndB with AHSA1/START domain